MGINAPSDGHISIGRVHFQDFIITKYYYYYIYAHSLILLCKPQDTNVFLAFKNSMVLLFLYESMKVHRHPKRLP